MVDNSQLKNNDKKNQIANFKNQIKPQITNYKNQKMTKIQKGTDINNKTNTPLEDGFGICNFFVIWCLLFGAYASLFFRRSMFGHQLIV
jgi:hypothetical protein